MKKYYLLSVIALTGMGSFISCNNKEDVVIPSGDKVEVSFASNIATVNSVTKAAGDTWHANDAIGVYMFEKEETNVVEEKANIKYVTETGGSTDTDGVSFEAGETVIYFPDNGEEVRFMAYYPYTGEIVDNVYKVDVSNQTSQEDIDLLYSFNQDGIYSKTTSSNVIPMTFNHKLTKIIVNVKLGTGFDESDFQDLEIHFAGLNTKANFNLIDSTLVDYSDKNVTIVPKPITTPKDGYKASYEAIVLPEAAANVKTAQIVFDLNGGDIFTWNFKKELEVGTKHTYNVTINRTGIIVEATIVDWIDGGEDNVDAE